MDSSDESMLVITGVWKVLWMSSPTKPMNLESLLMISVAATPSLYALFHIKIESFNKYKGIQVFWDLLLILLTTNTSFAL